MSFFSRRSGPRVRRSGPQALDARALWPLTAAALVFLLVVFYLVTIVNMGAIRNTVDDLNEHPYPVTVAAGQVETSLFQLKTLSERLEYVRTPEAVDAVEEEYARIDRSIAEPLQVVREQCRSAADEAHALSVQYDQLADEQRALVDLSRNPSATDADIKRFVDERVNPLVDSMVARNTAIIDGASSSFESLYSLADRASGSTIVLATGIMAAVLAALAIFLVVIKRKNDEQERLQQSLEHALETARQANRAKSQFLASMSHDIRTPCSAIVGLTEIAERHLGDPDRLRECLEKITLSSHHLIGLINDVLDMSKIESGRIILNDEPFNLDELVSFVDVIAQQQARTKQLVFQAETAHVAGTTVRGDALRVQQILLNLIGNAVKYTEPGGVVRLRVRRCPDGEEAKSGCASDDGTAIPCTSGDAGNVAVFRFQVEDNGIGMTAEFVKRMFEPFERERTDDTRGIEGTGLGMAITKSIVDQMGGSIKVESERHRGTTFTVDLPLLLESPESIAAAEAGEVSVLPKRVDFSGARVLLAEDNDINAEIACDIIGRTHAEVTWVDDGRKAVEALRGAPDGWFDLVFMDVEMPNMDGLAASRAVREACRSEGRRQPVIVAMTANAYVEDRKRAFEAGMDDYLVKPFGFAEMCDMMDAHLPPQAESDARHAANESVERAMSLV